MPPIQKTQHSFVVPKLTPKTNLRIVLGFVKCQLKYRTWIISISDYFYGRDASWDEQLALENVGLCKMVRRQLVGTRRGLIIISTILHQSVLGPGGANCCWDASRVDEIVGLNFSLKNPWLEKKREGEGLDVRYQSVNCDSRCKMQCQEII